jgi:hypothetical protein
MLALDYTVLPNMGLVFSDRAYANPHFLSVAQGFDSSLEVWPIRSLYGRLDSAHVRLIN